MAKYLLTNKAVEDLSIIWEYTCEFWSEAQADIYYFTLLEDCQKLANNPALGKTYDLIDFTVRGYLSGQHLIFYRTISASIIEITRVLHARMDLKNRLID